MTVDEILDEVIKAEGGYVDHPADKGGPTNWGVTLATLCVWRNNVNLSADDVRNLSEAEARQIYRNLYFNRPGFSALPESLWPVLVDSAVNHGAGTATRMLQRALKVKDDGVIGPLTLAVAKTFDPHALEARFIAERARKYGRIITEDPKQAVFAAGWMSRLARFIERLG